MTGRSPREGFPSEARGLHGKLSYMPQVGTHDVFEDSYRGILKARLAPHGLVIEYNKDRAKLDIGLHLYEHPPAPDPQVSNVRVWFQLKGIRTSTLSTGDLAGVTDVPVGGLEIDTVKYWYAAPEPVCLALYVEALDDFLVEDVRTLVDRHGGPLELGRRSRAGQETMTLRLLVSSTLTGALERMPEHRSLRLDGPDWRGRPLGHRYDPLRSELAPFEPDTFESLVGALLAAHDFRPSSDLRLSDYLDFPGRAIATLGTLYLTYEWTSPLFTEYGFDPGTEFRIESPPEYAHGEVLVVVHSDVGAPPKVTTDGLVDELRNRGVTRSLVFLNSAEMDSALFGAWRVALGNRTIPQGLGSLAFNVLTATSVYLAFLEHIGWKYVNYVL